MCIQPPKIVCKETFHEQVPLCIYRTDVDIPDQTLSPAGNGTNNTLTKLIVAYENAAADATRSAAGAGTAAFDVDISADATRAVGAASGTAGR